MQDSIFVISKGDEQKKAQTTYAGAAGLEARYIAQLDH
jgi:hypothetical protein